MRDFHLTSPLMHGTDVQHLQVAANKRLAARGDGAYSVKPDGHYGPATAHAVAIAARDLGLPNQDGRATVTQLIEHPELRSPADLIRAAAYAKARKQHPAGLAAIPKIGAHYLGIHESPAGSNRGNPEPSAWEQKFGMDGVSWCGCFAGNMVILAGGHVTSRVAYCPSIEADARSGMNGFARWTTDHAQAAPGWLVLYDWTGGKSFPEHVGIVESLHADHVTAIEGNTGGSNPSDGGMVAREDRPYSFVVGFAKPRI